MLEKTCAIVARNPTLQPRVKILKSFLSTMTLEEYFGNEYNNSETIFLAWQSYSWRSLAKKRIM